MIVDANDACPCGSGLRFKLCCQDEENRTSLDSPEELIAFRFAALVADDYEQLFASYHRESPFLQQFSDRGSYLRFAREQLREVELKSWQALAKRNLSGNQVEQLLAMEIVVDGSSQFFYELALLVQTGAGWRYHSAQKLSGEDYCGLPDQIDFHHFDHAAQKIRF